MKTSAAGRALIVEREGRRLNAYRDSVGVWTIGVGHTGRMAPPPVTPGMRIDEAQCAAMLAADLAPVEQAIATAVRVPLTQNERDALASFGFNVGVGGLRRSGVVARLNLGDVQGAADAFLAWSKPAVLLGRRKVERAQFLKPDPAGSDVIAERAKVLEAKAVAAKADARLGTQTSAGIGAASIAVAAARPRPSITPHSGPSSPSVLVARSWRPSSPSAAIARPRRCSPTPTRRRVSPKTRRRPEPSSALDPSAASRPPRERVQQRRKAPNMSTSNIITAAEKAGVDAVAGLANVFGNIGAQLKAGSTVVKAGVATTAGGAAIPASASGSLGQVETAIKEIEAIVADAKAGKWANEVEDVFDLLTTGMAILAKFGVSVPGLSQLAGLLPMIEAIV